LIDTFIDGLMAQPTVCGQVTRSEHITARLPRPCGASLEARTRLPRLSESDGGQGSQR